MTISQIELKELLDYNQETGVFTWRVSKSGNKGIGSIAGTNWNGYNQIKVNCKKYLTHRLAWLYVHGEWPNVIDHINGIKDDNRIENLRNVTCRENQQNLTIHRNGNLLGTTYDINLKKWRSQIHIKGYNVRLGSFDTKELAHKAYLNKLKELNHDNES